MRVIALDIGDKRIGVAYADTKTKVSNPVKVVSIDELKEVIYDYEPDMLLSGLPLGLNGEETEQTKHVRDIANSIANKYNLKLEFIDERLSSKEAKNILRAQGLSEREMKGKVDAIAASLFLETWIEQLQ
ncbi:MAG: Holliday junction resolvase RuvX [Coriobacteriia bacterium]|nr:Holliday junction resolvase RuvX [Coriobacteriia bacterium]